MTLFLTVVAANVQYGINKYDSDSEWFSKIIADETGTGTGTSSGSGSGTQCPSPYDIRDAGIKIVQFNKVITCDTEGKLDIPLIAKIIALTGSYLFGLDYPVNRYFYDCARPNPGGCCDYTLVKEVE